MGTTEGATIDHQPTSSSYESRLAREERLSLPIAGRLLLCASAAAIAGFTLGAAHGSIEAGYRFRAENAHRLPRSQTGWYLYHKSKNYNAMYGGAIEGLKMSAKVSFWAVLFLAMEEATDGFRQGLARHTRGEQAADRVSKDFLSTVIAGMGTAGAFSLWNRFPLVTAARTAKTGIKVGLAYGLLQDGLGLLRGRRLGYVDWVSNRFLTRDRAGRSSTAVLD